MKRGKPVVYLQLSGGVDSAVAGSLLLEQGYEVVPVFLKWWENPETFNVKRSTLNAAECSWQEDQEAALAVAKALGVADRFRVWNFSREFTQQVLQPLIEDAKQGRTGNPDVDCNRVVKFGAFFERALQEGADYVATGHYARISPARDTRGSEIQRPESADEGLQYQLFRAKCAAKNDQTYFLWQLNQTQLSRSLFPIGDFSSKEAVREEARQRGLPVADRKSTRGICGIEKRNYVSGYADFLGQYIPERKGEVVTHSGRVVGTHRGVARYTLGQRQGIGVRVDGGPYYIIAKDETTNRLIVAPPAQAQTLWRNEAVVGGVNWLSGQKPGLPLRCEAFIRHPQEKTVCCTVLREKTRNFTRKNAKKISRDLASGLAVFRVRFEEAQYAPAPGQSIVFYDGEVVLGGGVIQGNHEA